MGTERSRQGAAGRAAVQQLTWVARLWWLERLSVITAIVPVGLACSSRARIRCQEALLREGAQSVTACPSPIRRPP